MAEQVWGDVPSPAKRLAGAAELLEDQERTFLYDNRAFFPLSEEETHILKLADIAAGMLECVQERALGNRFMRAPYERFAEYYVEMGRQANVTYDENSIPTEAKTFNAIQTLWEQANESER